MADAMEPAVASGSTKSQKGPGADASDQGYLGVCLGSLLPDAERKTRYFLVATSNECQSVASGIDPQGAPG